MTLLSVVKKPRKKCVFDLTCLPSSDAEFLLCKLKWTVKLFSVHGIEVSSSYFLWCVSLSFRGSPVQQQQLKLVKIKKSVLVQRECVCFVQFNKGWPWRVVFRTQDKTHIRQTFFHGNGFLLKLITAYFQCRNICNFSSFSERKITVLSWKLFPKVQLHSKCHSNETLFCRGLKGHHELWINNFVSINCAWFCFGGKWQPNHRKKPSQVDIIFWKVHGFFEGQSELLTQDSRTSSEKDKLKPWCQHFL